MGREELIEKYNAGQRDFFKIDLSGADLQGIDLTEINLTEANLTKADLTGTNLQGINLLGVNLTKANLSRAILTRANLSWVNLNRANLTEADLTGTNLFKVDLSETNLQGTCLDPQASVSKTDLSCFKADGDYLIGYRTKDSQHNGNTIYEPGSHHVAPWFSVCTETECHPGIYLATLTWLKDKYPRNQYVKVKALKAETLKVNDKYRAKQIWVLEDV